MLIWAGNEPLNVSEMILKDELVDLYGLANIHQFIDTQSAAKFLHRRTSVRAMRPAVIAIYSPELDAEICEFFSEHDENFSMKIIALVCGKCKQPCENTQQKANDIAILTKKMEGSIRDYLIQWIGPPTAQQQEPVQYMKHVAGH